MPYRLDTHVLTVDANVIHKVDTGNPANLYSMWTVFSRCADSVEQGRRLENLSWRLWQRETFVVVNEDKEAATATTQTVPQNIPTDTRASELPQLSGSVESVADEEAVDFTSVSAPLEIARPHILRQDSCASKRERHISSDDFEKMIVSIVKDKGPLSAPTQVSPAVVPKTDLKAIPLSTPTLERSGSTTSDSQSPSKSPAVPSTRSSPSSHSPRTTVVRGFSPSQVPMARTVSSHAQTASVHVIPEPEASPVSKPVQSKKQPAKFAFGGSFSSSERDQSVDDNEPIIPIIKKPVFQIGGSSEEDGSLRSAMASSRHSSLLSPHKKQASFSSRVMTHTIDDEAAIESDSDDFDESAIDDDDDSSDWEDSCQGSGGSSVNNSNYFQRVDSKLHLTSRPSLITLALEQSGREARRAANLGGLASQSTSAIPRSRPAPNGPSLGGSPNDSDEGLMLKGRPGLKPIHEAPRSNALPIASQPRQIPSLALSPRTTRRNMLSTELTVSLRRHILNEREDKKSAEKAAAKAAAIRRRYTSNDIANLKQYPQKPCMKQSEDIDIGSFNEMINREDSNGYHSKGW